MFGNGNGGFNPMQMLMGGGKGGFNPMQMMMGGGGPQGGNPMQMMMQMMNGNPQMAQLMKDPQMQGAVQNIMSGNVSQDQMQGMLNQAMGSGAPNIGALIKKIQELQANGEVIVLDNQQAYQKAQQFGLGDVVRYSPKVKGADVMALTKYNSEYK